MRGEMGQYMRLIFDLNHIPKGARVDDATLTIQCVLPDGRKMTTVYNCRDQVERALKGEDDGKIDGEADQR